MAIPIDEHTLLLLHGEEIKDSSPFNVPITNNGIQVRTAQSKFGGKSLYFNGNSRILFPQNAVSFKDNNFTIDWWENCESGSLARFCTSWDNWGGLLIGFQGTYVYCGSAANSWDIVTGTQMIDNSYNQWVHWAIVRYGNILTSYKNGKKFAQVSVNGAVWDSGGRAVIGDYASQGPNSFKGYIDEFRVSDTARWTTDFTPPTEPYTEIPDFSYKTQVPLGTSKKIYARLYPQSYDEYFQTDLTGATVDLTLNN